jgi:hypothetical protein
MTKNFASLLLGKEIDMLYYPNYFDLCHTYIFLVRMLVVFIILYLCAHMHGRYGIIQKKPYMHICFFLLSWSYIYTIVAGTCQTLMCVYYYIQTFRSHVVTSITVQFRLGIDSDGHSLHRRHLRPTVMYTDTATLAYDPSMIRSLFPSHWSLTRLCGYTLTPSYWLMISIRDQVLVFHCIGA